LAGPELVGLSGVGNEGERGGHVGTGVSLAYHGGSEQEKPLSVLASHAVGIGGTEADPQIFTPAFGPHLCRTDNSPLVRNLVSSLIAIIPLAASPTRVSNFHMEPIPIFHPCENKALPNILISGFLLIENPTCSRE
jgi:hypothetical protein